MLNYLQNVIQKPLIYPDDIEQIPESLLPSGGLSDHDMKRSGK